MPDINQGSFTDFVNVVNRLGIPATHLAGVLMLLGTDQITTENLYKAWQVYQSSPAFKSYGVTGTARAAS